MEIHTENDDLSSTRTFVKGEKELNVLQKAIEDSNHMLLIQLKLKPKELLTLRFKHSMNILQAACYFSSESVVTYLRDVFAKDPKSMSELIEYQEPFGGNMAIHFAALKGSKRIIDMLMKDFNAQADAKTSNGLSIMHCAAQFERGTLSIEMFAQTLSIDIPDSFNCTPLHFAVLNL